MPPEELPEPQSINKLSRTDELLKLMIPIVEQIRDKEIPMPEPSAELTELIELLSTQHAIDYEPFTLTYPFNGTRLTIAAGTTVFDFAAGTVKAPGAAVAEMTSSLSKHRKEFMRALTFNADSEIILQIESENKLLCRAGNWPVFPSKEFTKVRVTVTESTEILIIASTSPAAITQMIGEVSPNLAAFTGDVYENEHTMTDNVKYRFESSSVLLRDVIIRVSENAAVIGDSSNQRYPKSIGSTCGFTRVDLSKLYIKNAGAGANTKINILGTRL